MFQQYLLEELHRAQQESRPCDFKKVLHSTVLRDQWAIWAANAMSIFQHQKTDVVLNAWKKSGLADMVLPKNIQKAIQMHMDCKLFEGQGLMHAPDMAEGNGQVFEEDIEEAFSDLDEEDSEWEISEADVQQLDSDDEAHHPNPTDPMEMDYPEFDPSRQY